MTIAEAKATIYANVVYACEKAGFAPQTTRLVKDACDTIIALADRKTKPHHSGEVTEMVEPQTWTKENCKGCKYNDYPYDSGTCFVRVCINGNKYEPKDEPLDKDINVRSKTEPQTDCAWK